ncbi:hypothetical protein ACLOAV_006995 [Pseudogymnoascus australis]
MSDNWMASLARRILGGNKTSQQDMEIGIPQPSNAVHPQLQAHADYGGRHDFGTDERLIIFRHLTGITSHPSMIQSQFRPGGRAAPNLGIYARVVKNEANAKKGYENFSWLINGCLGLQIIVAASLTALGAADASHSAITVLGAINTVIAGLLTFLKGSGLPNRLSYYHTQWKQIRELIEQRERDFSRPGCDLDVHGVVLMIETMYEEVKKDMEASTPDRFAGFGMSRKQAENAGKDAVFNLPRIGAGGLGEKLKDIQPDFGDEGLEGKPADFDSTLRHKAQEGLKGKFKEPESGLAGRAKDPVMRMGHESEVVRLQLRDKMRMTMLYRALEIGGLRLSQHTDGVVGYSIESKVLIAQHVSGQHILGHIPGQQDEVSIAKNGRRGRFPGSRSRRRGWRRFAQRQPGLRALRFASVVKQGALGSENSPIVVYT